MNRLIPAVVAIAAAALAALLFAPGAPALGDRHTGDADLAARTRAVIDDTNGLRGLAVASVENGQARLAGLGDAADGRPVDADTAFEPGSVTKTWTAMLLADMIEAGEVRTADTLATLLPGRTFADRRSPTSPWRSLPATVPACRRSRRGTASACSCPSPHTYRGATRTPASTATTCWTR
jgi:CubicO group peptidase (beta-lactamase class C family)